MERTERGGLLKGAAIIATGGLLAKLLGAFYRIPLTNLIGGEGIGLYQLVYPFYCLLLTISATGIPSSIATLTARRLERRESARPLFSVCMRLFLTIGGVSTALMALLAPLLSLAQGELRLTGGYLALCPSVFFVSAISVFRGYFQGKGEMLPTAASEVLEQAVKVGLGLLLAWIFRANLYTAVTALLFAVTLSEGAALCFLLMRFRRSPAPLKLQNLGEIPSKKSILRLSIPVTLSACLIPLFGMVDSILLVRLLRGYTDQAVALYGLFSGGAVTMINLPVSVCYGIAAASVPALSAAVTRGKGVRKKLTDALSLTLLLGALATVALLLFAAPAVRILFGSLSAAQSQTLVALVKTYAISALLLSATQTLSACLTAMGKPALSAVAMAVAMTAKTVISVLLVGNPTVSVQGAAIAGNIGYGISFALDVLFAYALAHKREKGL